MMQLGTMASSRDPSQCPAVQAGWKEKIGCGCLVQSGEHDEAPDLLDSEIAPGVNPLKTLWVSIRSSLWFVPTIIVAVSILLAVGLVEADKHLELKWAERFPLLFGAGADGSRGMLSTIAGSMITVAGITFSLTIAALVTASGQYTSRILRNFMRDRRNQFVLGCFVGIFTYCLVVLRTIRGTSEGDFIPSLAVFAGLLLAVLGIAVLVFFIHHIATSIQATTIIASITAETLAATDRAFPDDAEQAPTAEQVQAFDANAEAKRWRPVGSRARGYVQNIAATELLKLAQEHGVIVRLDVRPGDFATEMSSLMSISEKTAVEEQALAKFLDSISINRFRTIDQEPGFGIRQLVDIALKALSPGINDTTTAVMCIDHLAAALAHVAARAMPMNLKAEDGQVRLIMPGTSFADMLDMAFDQIRNNAARNVAVMAHMLRAIATIASRTVDVGRRESLRHHLALVSDLARRTIDTDHDRDKVEVERVRAIAALDAQTQPVRRSAPS